MPQNRKWPPNNSLERTPPGVGLIIEVDWRRRSARSRSAAW